MAERDHYEVLGVDPKATPADIKAAFRRLAKQLHPDKQDAEDAADQFMQLNRSYEVLADPARRRHFDWLRSQRVTAPKTASAPTRSAAAPNERSVAKSEGERRRNYRHEVAREVGRQGDKNVAQHAEWLDQILREEVENKARKKKATLWLAVGLLMVVLALLAFSQR